MLFFFSSSFFLFLFLSLSFIILIFGRLFLFLISTLILFVFPSFYTIYSLKDGGATENTYGEKQRTITKVVGYW